VNANGLTEHEIRQDERKQRAVLQHADMTTAEWSTGNLCREPYQAKK